MNVWIVNPFDNLPQEGNRPQRYWLMAQAFVQAGHCVMLWTSDFSHATKQRRCLRPEIADEKGIAVRLIPTLPYSTNVCFARIRSHRRLARDFERLAYAECEQSPALVIASTPPLGLCAAAMRVAKHYGARFVCDIQDAWPETFERLLPRGFKGLGYLLFASMRNTARRLYREADLVTGVCERYATLSGRKDFRLAYLGIAGGVEGESKPLKDSKDHLVYVGNLGMGYDLETVMRAMVKRSNLTLDIAGSGPREPDLRAEAVRLGLKERVHFHGYLGSDDLHALMARCDVGIIPMRDDSWVGIPNKLVDYLNAGLYVLSSLHGECGALLSRMGFGCTYDRVSPDLFLAAIDALPATSVSLPAELRAERIYPDYVRAVTDLRTDCS